MALRRGIAGAALAGAALWPGAAVAQVESVPSLVVTAGGAYSTSPFLQSNGSGRGGAASTQLDVRPSVTLLDGTDSAIVSGNYNRADYFSRYGSNSGYGVTTSANKRLNPRASIGVFASFDSSILGVNNGFITPATPVPTLPVSGADGSGSGIATGVGTGAAVPVLPTLPAIPSTLPFDPTGVDGDVGLIGARQRRSQLSAGLNGSYSVDARSSWNAGINASRASYPGRRSNPLFVTGNRNYGASFGYTRALTEVSSIGFQLNGSIAEFGNGRSSRIATPRLTYSRTLSERWILSAAVGAGITGDANAGLIANAAAASGTRVTVSADASLCRSGERLSGCITGARVPTLSGIGGVRIQNTVSTSFSYVFNSNMSAGIVGSYSRVEGVEGAQVPGLLQGTQELFSASASLQRRLDRRLSLVGSVGYQSSNSSFINNAEDVTARLGVSLAVGRFQ